MVGVTDRTGPGPAAFMLAGISAFAFASSGPLGKALIDAGWSPEAAVAVRISGAALVLLPVVMALAWPSRGRMLRDHARHLITFGLVAVAGAQIGFFNAVRTLPVGVALLLEYLSPLVVVGWLWVVRAQRPSRLTMLGAAVALAGTTAVIDPFGGFGLDPVGVLWALFATACSAGYFLLAARQHPDLPAVVMIGAGFVVGALAVLLAGATGVLTLQFATGETDLAGAPLPWWVPALGLVLISCLAAYGLGIVSVRRLGSRLASFVALTEVLFAVLLAWWLLGEAPTSPQALGGCLVLAGIVLVRVGEQTQTVSTPDLTPGTGTTTPAAPGR
jgi:drug/metabolite transporter (DMT)-like permease